MKPAVIMMFRDEADILAHSLKHWYKIGIRDFYLCDNGSADGSLELAHSTMRELQGVHYKIILDQRTNWPGKEVINSLIADARKDGCDWLFPCDADEFLCLEFAFSEWLNNLSGWYPSNQFYGELRYLNIMPDGREYWQEPHRKVFGIFGEGDVVSMGNHLIENKSPNIFTNSYYRHYSMRSYPQFKRKMENYMIAFNQLPFKDHPHAVSYQQWQKEGEPYLQNLWNTLTGLNWEQCKSLDLSLLPSL